MHGETAQELSGQTAVPSKEGFAMECMPALLQDHVTLQVESVDRVYLNGYVLAPSQTRRAPPRRPEGPPDDFEAIPPGAALPCNLSHPDHVTLVCGSLDDLPARFSAIAASAGRTALPDPAPRAHPCCPAPRGPPAREAPRLPPAGGPPAHVASPNPTDFGRDSLEETLTQVTNMGSVP